MNALYASLKGASYTTGQLDCCVQVTLSSAALFMTYAGGASATL